MVEERLEILRRIAERGLTYALENCHPQVDIFQHLIDEIERTKREFEKCQTL